VSKAGEKGGAAGETRGVAWSKGVFQTYSEIAEGGGSKNNNASYDVLKISGLEPNHKKTILVVGKNKLHEKAKSSVLARDIAEVKSSHNSHPNP